MSTESSKFTETTKRISAKMAGERCSICEEQTSRPNSKRTNYINLGEAAHINGANKADNNRFDEELTSDNLRHISNCIWLCKSCHKLIDSDEKEYTVSRLKLLKEEHFQRVLEGRYGSSTFLRISELNEKVESLSQQISDKEKIIAMNEKLLDFELTKLKVERDQVAKERDELSTNYNSLIESIGFVSSGLADRIAELVFEENELDKALELLDEEELNKQEFDLARKRVLKGDIFYLKKAYSDALDNYRKAFELNNSFEISASLVLYLESVNAKKELIDTLEKIIVHEGKTKKRPKKIITLKSSLARLLSESEREKSIKLYSECLDIINTDLKENEDYALYKAGYTNYLAISLMNGGNLQEAFKLCEESLNLFFEGQFTDPKRRFSELCSLYNTIAQIYELNSKTDYAVEFYLRALQIIKQELKDELKLKIATILNISNCPNERNLSLLVELLTEAIGDLRTLMDKSPLSYFEMLIGAYCKKSDLLLLGDKRSESEQALVEARLILDQALLINPEGFKLIQANIVNRQAVHQLRMGNSDEALKLVIQAISIYEESAVSTREVFTKIGALVSLKNTLHSDNSIKMADLEKAIKNLELVYDQTSTDGFLLIRLQQEWKALNS